jgi:uncharacterized membrane-anchored protein YhcB (DUF1043 family)
MTPAQIMAYINIWACLLTGLAFLIIGVILDRLTVGLTRQAQAYQAGLDKASRQDKGLYTALHD